MTDRPGNDNDKEKVSRLTMSDLNRHWDDMLSGFRGAGAGSDDIEIHSFEDLGLDEHGIDLSSGDADPASSGPSSRPAAVSRAQLREAQYPVSDLAGTREFQRIETNEPETDHHTAPKTPAPAAQEPRAAEPAPAPEPEPESTFAPEPAADILTEDEIMTDPSEKRKAGGGAARRPKKKKKKKGPLKMILGLIFLLFCLAALCGCAYTGYVILTTPDIDTSNIYANIAQNSIIYDDQGEVLESVATSENRTNISYSDMPPNLVNAFVAIEDKTFFTHRGFNFVRILGAIKESLFTDKNIGGTSTITQQLARNIYLTQERSMTRKIREAYYTVILEKELSKEQIMEAYLNTINLGYGAYGVQAAAQSYFGCDVQDLTIAQCAVLASLPKSPSNYAPLRRYADDQLSAENPDILLEDSGYVVVYSDAYRPRQETVLKFMNEQGYITEAEYTAALGEDIRSELSPKPMSTAKVSSYFGDYCISEVIGDLVDELKMDEEDAKNLVYSGGVRIYSTLNVEMQKAAEEEFSKTSNFPSVTGLRKQKGTGNILSDAGKILLYSKKTYFNDDGTFTLSSDEFTRNASGDLVILKDHRLNIYSVSGADGQKVPQIEFKNLYVIRDGIFYSINGGVWTGIGAEYLSKDDDGNVVISARFLTEHPDHFIIGNSTVSIGPEHYTLHQETIQPQSAMVITDYTKGEIKVMVGGRSLSGRLLYNRAINPRQPGSSIKPIGVYGPAIQSGVDLGTKWTAGTTIEDAENIVNGKVWPKNAYSGYKGWVTLRTCVEQSINVCSVKLVNDIGYDYSVKFLKANGVSSIVESGNVNDMNPAALGLGGMTKGIAPVEMASAYGTFPNEGVYIEPSTYTKVTDAKGNVILEKNHKTERVYDEGVAFIMTDILRTTVTNGIAGRAAIGTQPVGGKTGTTTDNMDAWFCGFTPQFSAALWIGNDVNIELSKGSGAAASLWSRVMKKVCAGYDRGSFPSRPSNVYVSGGEYYVDGTSRSGPAPGSGKEDEEEAHELLTDETGRTYYLDDSGNRVYVDADGKPLTDPNAPNTGTTDPANPSGTDPSSPTDPSGGGTGTGTETPVVTPEPQPQPEPETPPSQTGVIDDPA